MSAFTPAAAASSAGPDWLSARRTAAAERFAAATLPSWEEEVWRYSPIDRLDLDRYELVSSPGADGLPGVTGFDDAAARIVFVDGRLVALDVDDGWAAKGLAIGTDVVEGELGSVLAEPTDVFATMNDAFATEPLVVRIPRGVEVDGPIVVEHRVATSGSATFPRLVVQAGANSSARVVELHRSSDVEAFVAPVVELAVADAARLGHLVVQDLGPQVWQIGSVVADVAQQASLAAAAAAFGGHYGRLRFDARLTGRGANGDLTAVYFGDDDQTLDFRTFQDHIGRDTTSNLTFKGAVDDHSRSIYTGLIRVHPDAAGSNAVQSNRNIKLSDHAWAESVPNLEIENNDVRCSHASAVGPIDPDHLFYLESRGVPTEVAERLVVAGFFAEVLDQLPVPAAGDLVRRRLQEKLG